MNKKDRLEQLLGIVGKALRKRISGDESGQVKVSIVLNTSAADAKKIQALLDGRDPKEQT